MRLKNYLVITRIDHWFKNFLILPGTIFAALLTQNSIGKFWLNLLLGLVSTCFAASANYVINEWVDAKFDRFHPIKKNRPSVVGKLKGLFVYLEYGVLILFSLYIAVLVSRPFLITIISFLAMGVIYNLRPFRTKDKAFLDVLSESINNPIRLMLGWFIVTTKSFPPSSLFLGYWMGGAFLMAVKRFAELRYIGDSKIARLYRRSFYFYTEKNLLVSSLFYAVSSAFFLGVFLIKYRIELLLSLPFFAILYAWYLHIGFKNNSVAQNPEKLFKEKGFFAYIVFLIIIVLALLFIDLPWLKWFLENAFINQ